jgi:tyrosine-protein phosphatase SIW14
MGPMQVPGVNIKNFGVVAGHIYRGNQPDEADYAALKALGISTVVDLRDDARPYAKHAAEAAGLTYINIPMNDTDRPYDEQIAAFLKIVTNPAYGKCFVHCAGGRHRTGVTIACYRMAVQGWSADAAYSEMKAYDFYTRWGHGAYKTYVFDYYKRMQTDPTSVPMAFTAITAGVSTPFVAQP